MQNGTQTRGYLLVLAAGSLWGTIGLFSTLLADAGMSAQLVALARVLFAALLLAPMLLLRGRGLSAFRISKRGLFSCILVGLFSQAFFNICYMNTIERCGMATGAVFLYTSPVYVALLSRLLFREALTPNKLIAILLNIAGCILTVTGGDLIDICISGFGLVMGLLAGFTYALLPILSRIGADKEDPLTAAFYGLLFGTLFLFLLVRPFQGQGLPTAPATIALILGFGFFSTAAAYGCYYAGISRITETSRIPVLASVETVVAALIGLVAFGQTIGTGKLAGIALVLCSIVVMNYTPRKRS